MNNQSINQIEQAARALSKREMIAALAMMCAQDGSITQGGLDRVMHLCEWAPDGVANDAMIFELTSGVE